MIIRNNILYGNELYVPWIGPCKIYDGNGIIVDSENNSTIGKPAYTGRTLIENNVVYYNGGRGIHMLHSNAIDVINNTCYQNDRSPAIADGEITVQGATNVRVFNNIMYARSGENANYKDGASTGFSSGNNLIYNASGSYVKFTSPTDVIGQDPQFVNTDINAGNFRLLLTSPAIDKGSNVTGQFSVKDITGATRPFDTKPDIGAYEISLGLPTDIAVETVKHFIVYPSPTTGLLLFANTAEKQVSLFSITGECFSRSENVTDRLDISQFAPGVYLLHIKLGMQEDIVKVIKL